MEVQEVTKLLRHYRHDWMNELQIVHGYAAMNKMDKVQEKLDEIIANSREEAKLMSLQAPYFALWILQCNMLNDNCKLTYQIEAEEDWSEFDQELVNQCEAVVQIIQACISPLTLCELHVRLKQTYVPRLHFEVCVEVTDEKELQKRIETVPNVHDFIIDDNNEQKTYNIYIDMKER
ncbi:Spo0B domain-containing protein [Pontibacillus litoralis]|uniref:SpoOB alpha-helical domain-containing protein n=1 Tax=Pontibacillus litoralis JSM 072002 TaxID=1385512 RepID=A0A0A5GDK0_9BACI|nr:Spo0B domain-containing protein [Pontibacillus litoralis]KGX89200.1 hypothetical protein N784_01340 [Pontibacillus litoralis JSM 072002]